MFYRNLTSMGSRLTVYVVQCHVKSKRSSKIQILGQNVHPNCSYGTCTKHSDAKVSSTSIINH